MRNLVFFILFLCATPSAVFAYLDPSSGSLLLSSVVALFASAVFFVKNIFYKLTHFIPMLFSGSYDIRSAFTNKNHSVSGGGGLTLNSNKNLISSIVFYSESDTYYATFKPILDALDSLFHPYTYYTSSQTDMALSRQNTSLAHFEYIGTGNKAYTKLNFLKADILVLTAPGLDVLHIKRSRGVKHYCHIVHSLTPMTYRAFGIDYFDSVLVSNSIQQDFIRDIESAHNVKPKHIAIVGSTYLDWLSSQFQDLKDSPIILPNPHLPTILISPSWGKETLLSKLGLTFLEILAKCPYNIIIRPHPQSLIGEVESRNVAHLQDSLKDYKNVIWDIGTPNVYAFAKADLMISDFSSVIFDFVCLCGKPVLTLQSCIDWSGYDMADIPSEKIWTLQALDLVGERFSHDELDTLKSRIDNLLQKPQTHTLNQVSTSLWAYPHQSGIKSAAEILKIESEIIEQDLSPYKKELARLREIDMMIERLHNDN